MRDVNNFRTRLELHKPDIPTRKVMPLPVDSNHDQFVEFTHSDYDADAAQSTVPFVDIQPVQPMKGMTPYYFFAVNKYCVNLAKTWRLRDMYLFRYFKKVHGIKNHFYGVHSNYLSLTE